MQKNDRRFIFLIVFMVLGIALTLQFRSTLYTNKQKVSTTINNEMLKARIEEQTNIENELKTRIDYNLKKKDRYLKAIIEKKNDDKLMARWEDIRLKAGLTDVEGPGVIIRLDDATARKTGNPSLLIIHESDIKIILNDLKKAGAQAISINNERIIATSEQVCAGPTIMINKSRYAVPYIIKVIGDPDILAESMNHSERIDLMIKDNIRIEIKKADNVFIPKFNFPERLISGLEVVKE